MCFHRTVDDDDDDIFSISYISLLVYWLELGKRELENIPVILDRFESEIGFSQLENLKSIFEWVPVSIWEKK